MYPLGMKVPPGAPPPLPPLTALRAFECAARHKSFTRAAEELCVTQTAVSHQVKLLEAHLGALLFQRHPRRVVLTREGLAWARALHDVFSRLYDANAKLRIRARPDRPVVAVSVIPSFAARWLVPRLGRFLEENPGVDVRVSPNELLVDFGVEAVDLGVRYGSGSYPGLVTEKLADDAFVVVCAPELRAKKSLAAPEDLRRHVLLHDDARDAWPRTADSTSMPESLSSVPPMPTGLAYYVVAPKENLARGAVARFRAFLKREAKVLRRRPSPPA
jgi:LysR family glycine cleavage system transcriptional activator